ncbi:MAG: hypothetical protein JWN21_827 [Sphingomonas bacterium]|nr:hypothetical protein [Sphingomonas bacterium]
MVGSPVTVRSRSRAAPIDKKVASAASGSVLAARAAPSSGTRIVSQPNWSRCGRRHGRRCRAPLAAQASCPPGFATKLEQLVARVDHLQPVVTALQRCVQRDRRVRVRMSPICARPLVAKRRASPVASKAGLREKGSWAATTAALSGSVAPANRRVQRMNAPGDHQSLRPQPGHRCRRIGGTLRGRPSRADPGPVDRRRRCGAAPGAGTRNAMGTRLARRG